MISSEPTLGDSWFVVVHDMSVIAYKEESSVVLEVDLHCNETICVTWKMVKGEALGEIYGSIVEGFPVEFVEREIVWEIGSVIGTGGTAEEGGF